MTHDPIRVEETRAWLLRAAEDLQAAERLLEGDTPLSGPALYHCQQAAEKSLKGFLLWHGQPFGKTHDLGQLGSMCAQIDSELEPSLRPAAGLTEYAWRYRYPGEPLQAPMEEAREALDLAREVRRAVVGRLPAETGP
jgi:HEPN domain-containing protein